MKEMVDVISKLQEALEDCKKSLEDLKEAGCRCRPDGEPLRNVLPNNCVVPVKWHNTPRQCIACRFLFEDVAGDESRYSCSHIASCGIIHQALAPGLCHNRLCKE